MIIKIPAISESSIATVDIWGQKTGTIPLRVTKGKYDGSKEIGSIIARHDGYIIADIYDEKRYRKIINAIHNGDVKAYMNYFADVDHAKDDAYSYATDIYIMYFALGPAIPGSTCDELNSLD